MRPARLTVLPVSLSAGKSLNSSCKAAAKSVWSYLVMVYGSRPAACRSASFWRRTSRSDATLTGFWLGIGIPLFYVKTLLAARDGQDLVVDDVAVGQRDFNFVPGFVADQGRADRAFVADAVHV